MSESPASLTARWGGTPVGLERLESEVDETYRAAFVDGSAAILKIAVAGTAHETLDFESAVVDAALATDPTLPLARTIATREGATRIEAGGRWARLVECLPGTDAAASIVDLVLVREIGRVAGLLTRALEGFRHPADERIVAWDVRRAPGLRSRIDSLPGAGVRDDVTGALDELEEALPTIERLPAQVVHNDINGGNVLVDRGRVTGIVDFGDAGFMPRVCDVGIAMSYTLGYTREPDVWAAPTRLLAGYRETVELSPDELAVLPVIVRARAAQRVLMSVAAAASSSEGRRDETERLARASADLRRLIAADDGGRGS
ncbi:phosphotransferase [Microbacterium sp.]|uniref:phosphotransferase n=1 Tax=Microbacterium sp. TaxID=51671 RepID=UPI003F7113FB